MSMLHKSILTVLCFCACIVLCAQNPLNLPSILIKGSIKFPDAKFPVLVYYYDGSEKVVVDSLSVSSQNTFEKNVQLPKVGVYYLDCQRWERLPFWGEDENVEVNFRGRDTAKVVMKNPPYEHIINAGKNNELMNLINYFDYQSYQAMIAASREMYQASQSNCDDWKKYVEKALDKSYELGESYMNFLATHYADRNSILYLLPRIRDKKVKENLIAQLEKEKALYPPFVAYKKEQAEKEELMARLAPGKLAPDFACSVKGGKRSLGPKDFRGKYLLIDFWASWCGPCRKAIPRVKEVYDKYHGRGLEVLSVSIDAKEADWWKAMEEENMPWEQVCAPHSGKELLKLYQFNGIPHLVLLDREGKIISRGINPTKLDEELSKIIK